MALTATQIQEIEQAGAAFLQKRRPSLEIRNKLDLAYRIEGPSVVVYEIRPNWQNPAEFMEGAVAKTTFVQTKNVWQVYWMRADLKWHGYKPRPSVKTIQAFFQLVDDDEYGCFFG